MSIGPKNHYKNIIILLTGMNIILKNHYYYEESFPYQFIQKDVSSEEFIVNPITNPADKSPEIYRKGFPHQFMQKIGHQPIQE